MKKLMLGVVALLIALSAQANGKIEVSYNKQIDKQVISVINTDMQYEEMVITNMNSGKIVLTRKIAELPSFHEAVKHSSFGTESYVIEIKGKNDVVSKKVTIANGNIIHHETNVNTDHSNDMKFFVLDEGNTLLISFINKNSETLNMEIVDVDAEKRVKKSYIGSKAAYSGKFNIAKLKSGTNYRAALYAGNTAYYYEFTK
ncbi:hypothetical protein E9993_17485 [Labilibacter sediminis]|nr:hypothetical protein E9993_17485 [Labilibacter sediminis]